MTLRTILLMAIASLMPVAITKVDELKTKIISRLNALRGKSVAKGRIFGWEWKVRIKDSDIDRLIEKVQEIDASDVDRFMERLVKSV